MEWKMEWNNEHTQLQLTRVTGAAQSRLNYTVALEVVLRDDVYATMAMRR